MSDKKKEPTQTFLPISTNGWLEIGKTKKFIEATQGNMHYSDQLHAIGISPFFEIVRIFTADEGLNQIRAEYDTAREPLHRDFASQELSEMKRRLNSISALSDAFNKKEEEYLLNANLPTRDVAVFDTSKGCIGFHIDFATAQNMVAMAQSGKVVEIIYEEGEETPSLFARKAVLPQHKKPITISGLRPL